MPICQGCGKNYRAGGYINHLRSTRRPRCAAVYQEYLARQAQQFPGLVDEQNPEGEEGGANQIFQGDYYGEDYGAGDFPGFEEEEDVIMTERSEGQHTDQDGEEGNTFLSSSSTNEEPEEQEVIEGELEDEEGDEEDEEEEIINIRCGDRDRDDWCELHC